jgi:ATP-dependent protease ClpP protease subunit
MISTVLLEGYLSEKVLKGALQEVSEVAGAGKRACVLVVCSPGGDIVPAMEFVVMAKMLPLLFSVKVYNAQSVAAFITLSLRPHAEMKRGSVMGLHRGRLKVEAPDLSREGQVPEAMLKALLEYNRQLDEVLSRNGIADPKLLAKFYGSGWLDLSADQCLEYGLVKKLF